MNKRPDFKFWTRSPLEMQLVLHCFAMRCIHPKNCSKDLNVSIRNCCSSFSMSEVFSRTICPSESVCLNLGCNDLRTFLHMFSFLSRSLSGLSSSFILPICFCMCSEIVSKSFSYFPRKDNYSKVFAQNAKISFCELNIML